MRVISIKEFLISAFAILAVCAMPTLQQEVNLKLSIQPNPAIAEEKVFFTCVIETKKEYKNAVFKLIKDKIDMTKSEAPCGAPPKANTNLAMPDRTTIRSNCREANITVHRAKRDKLAGTYVCDVNLVLPDYSMKNPKSDEVKLLVGDRTPPIKVFKLENSRTGVVITNGSKITAGLLLNVTCQTKPSDPSPMFNITITDKQTRNNGTISTSTVYFKEKVPRVPEAIFTCSVHNGFGKRQEKSLRLLPQYTALESEVKIPDELVVQTQDEVLLCSVPNNPPQPLELIGVKESLLAEKYPRYAYENGMSKAYVKFTEAAKSTSQLEVTCRVKGGVEAKKNVSLSGSAVTASNSETDSK